MYTYTVIILDINMPLMNGREFLKKMRSTQNTTPIIALTSDSLTRDKVEVLDMGADDYMTKPFESEELIARIHALSRRRENISHTQICIRELTFWMEQMRVEKDGKGVDISAKEW